MIKKIHCLGAGLVVSLALPFTLLSAKAQANSELPIAQAESAEPIDSCVALQEVSTGETEIRKRIENRVIARGNWNTDFLVPSSQTFSYFVAILTPENNATYEFSPTLRFSNGATETLFNVRSTLTANETYSIPFQSATARQPNLINARVGGVNGNFYTISIAGCP